MMTRSQELAQLAAFRNLTREDWDALSTTGTSRDESVGLRDQQRAAIEEMSRIAPQLATGIVHPPGQETGPLENRRGSNSLAALALLMAGLKRCDAGHACPHAETGDRPLTYHFAARVVTCSECEPRFRGPLAAQHRRVEAKTDTECDLCLTRGQEDFMAVMGQFGPAFIHADICEECEHIVLEGA